MKMALNTKMDLNMKHMTSKRRESRVNGTVSKRGELRR